MKKIISSTIAAALLFTAPVFAQDDTADSQEDEVVMPPPKKPSNTNELQNWLFAGGSLITAAIAILLVAWSPGSPPPSGQGTLPD